MNIPGWLSNFLKENVGDLLIELFSIGKIKDAIAGAGKGVSATGVKEAPDVWLGGILGEGETVAAGAAMSELDAPQLAKVNGYTSNNLNDEQNRRFRVFLAGLQKMREVYIEKEPVPAGTGKGGVTLYRDKENRKTFNPAANFLRSFADLTNRQKEQVCDTLGILTGDSEWIEEQKKKAKEVVQKTQREAVKAARKMNKKAGDIAWDVWTLGTHRAVRFILRRI